MGPVTMEAWNRLLVALRVSPCDWTAWLERRPEQGSRIPAAVSEHVRVPKLDEWFRSRDPNAIVRALALVELLELRAYLSEVLAAVSHEHRNV